MAIESPKRIEKTQRTAGGRRAFTEASAWESVQSGWRPMHGGFYSFGFSVEWHEFSADRDLDVSGSFHPGSVEICLNLAGRGEVRAGGRRLELAPLTAGFYGQTNPKLRGVRYRGEPHQFITVEFSREFVARHLLPQAPGVHPALRNLFKARPSAALSEATRLTSEQQALIRSLRNPPANAAARHVWAQAKAMEVATTVFYPAPAAGELFCDRVKRLNDERVQRVIAILKENLNEPPTLEEIGRRVGCSQFHLSRIFSEQMHCGIFQHLRTLRLERAAELICRGEMKITDVALEVGYASPSHFTTAFREAFGCCPGLYTLHLRSQQAKEATPKD